ncbi:MAG: SBBP repeat-containing protein [Cytophagales bacterium]|nr:SBBP repeat-containing protein [Cytophagales bacterium]
MTTDAGGNIYVVGAFTGTIDFDPEAGVVSAGPAFGSDIWFGKYTSTGSLIWARALIGGDDDFGKDISLDNSGNIYITGYFGTQSPLDFDPGIGTASPTVPKGLFFAKYNNSGTFQWVRTIGGSTAIGVRSNAIAIDASGNCHIAGEMSASQSTTYDFDPGAGTANLNTSNGSVFYAKYNSSGNFLWAKNVGRANSGSNANDLALDGSGNVHITGFFTGSADFHPSATSPILNSANGSAFVCKYNSSGNFVWSKQVTGSNGDMGMAMATDGTSNVFVTGSRWLNGGNVLLARFNSAGTQTHVLNIGGTSSDTGQALKVDGSGNIYMAGYFGGSNVDFNPNYLPPRTLTTGFLDFFIAKYSAADLSCQWAKNYDLQLTFTDFEINAVHISSGKLVAAGNFRGSGDFTTCGPATVFNATTVDGFLVGYNITDPGISMSGPDAICNPGEMSFAVYNVPIGASVTWSITPSSWVSSSSGSGSTFVTNLLPGSGPGTLLVTATISGACGNIIQREVQVGVPEALCTPEIFAMEPCNTLHAATCSGAPIYNWYIDSNLVVTSPFHDVGISLLTNPPLGAGAHSLCVSAQNGCGESPWSCTTFITGDCSFGQFGLGSPNPAQKELSFTMEKSGLTTLDYSYTYQLLDRNGAFVKGGTTNKNSITIDVRDVPRDTYYFEVCAGEKLIKQRIVIN